MSRRVVVALAVVAALSPARANAATLEFVPAVYTTPESAPNLRVTLRLSAPECDGRVSVPESVVTLRTLETGSATEGKDFRRVDEGIPFGGTGVPPITRGRVIAGLIIDDVTFEGTESFALEVEAPGVTAVCLPIESGESEPLELSLGPPATVMIVDDDEPTSLEIISGNDQTGRVGKPLPQPLVVKASKDDGNPVNGATVSWQVTAGEAQLGANPTVTNEEGRTENTVVLGSQPGEIRVTARLENGLQVEFGLTAELVASGLEIVSGDHQTGPVGEPLPEPLEVRATDDEGRSVPGAIVSWQVTAGEATLGNETAETDEQGRARNTVTLGSQPGEIRVTARLENGAQVEFELTAVLVPSRLEIVSGDQQMGPVGEPLPEPLEVLATADDERPVPGATVSWRVTAGEATLGNGTTETDQQGRARNTVILGSQPGEIRVRAGLENGAQVEFQLTAVLVPSGFRIVSGDRQRGSVGEPLPEPLRVRATASDGRPVPGATVSWRVTSGEAKLGTTATRTNEEGRTENTVVLGSQPGEIRVTARLENGAQVEFHLTAELVASGLEIVRGDGQTGRVGEGLDEPLVVRVTDQDDGRRVSGATVSWKVTAGKAELGNETTETDEDGLAENTVILGLQPGEIEVTASLAQGAAEVFRLTAELVSDLAALGETEMAVAEALTVVCSQDEIPAELRNICDDFAELDAAEETEALREIAPEEAAAEGNAATEAQATQLRNIGSRLAALRGGASRLATVQLALQLDEIQVPGSLLASLFAPPPAEIDLPALIDKALAGGSGTGDPEPRSAASDAPGGRLGIFLGGAIAAGDRPGTPRESGFDFDTLGITAGVDYRLTRAVILGGALGYLATDADLDAGGGALEVEGRSLSVYGTFYRSRAYLDWILSYGRHDFKLERAIDFPGRSREIASGEPEGDQIAFGLSGGYDLERGAVTLGGFGRVDYLETDIEGYRERGAPGFNLEIDSQKIESLLATAGLQLSCARSIKRWGVVAVPALSLQYLHEFEDEARPIVARFVDDPGGTSFAIPTEEPDRDYFKLGVGISAVFRRGRQVSVLFEKDLQREDLNIYSISFGLRLEL